MYLSGQYSYSQLSELFNLSKSYIIMLIKNQRRKSSDYATKIQQLDS